MKKIILMAFASLMMVVPALAQDQVFDDGVDASIERPGRPGDGRGPGRPGQPDRDRDRDRGGVCQVTFKKCRIQIGGFCVKWKNEQINVARRDSRFGCEIAENRYGQIKSCRVHCGGR